MRACGYKTLISFLLLLVTATTEGAIEDDWNAGKRAFVAGDYQSALVSFESAKDGGLESAAVHYNIAVSQFKLGDYAAARETFTEIGQRFPQMRGLAEYNLGLVARRQGDNADARIHFRNAYRYSRNNRKIRLLASRNLRELQPEVPTAARWSGLIGVRAGHDDNIALRDEAGLPVGTTAESPMTDLFASFSGPWNGRSGFRAEGNAYLVRYYDADDFDQSQIGGGAFYDWRPSDWRVQVGIRASALTLGGESYDRKIGSHVRLMHYLGSGRSLDFRYSYDDVAEGDDSFIGIAGERQRIDARYHWYRDRHRLQFRYRLETNDRLDPSVSPERNQVAFSYWYLPEQGFGFETGIDFRQSDYDEMATPRREDLLTLRAGVSYTIGDQWQLLAEYQNSENDSTDEAFSYSRGRYLIGLLKLF